MILDEEIHGKACTRNSLGLRNKKAIGSSGKNIVHFLDSGDMSALITLLRRSQISRLHSNQTRTNNHPTLKTLHGCTLLL